MATIDLNQARAITDAKEKEYGLPPGTLFKIGGIESSFNGNAVSPKGALGYFQFMPATARAYGLTDPSNFEMSADAAARYMRDNLKKYGGNMDLSLADYNGGPRAAAALAKGKPWAETKGYLTKFYGGKEYAPLPAQFTTGVSQATGDSPSAGELLRQRQINSARYDGVVNSTASVLAGAVEGWKSDNSVWNYFQQRGIESAVDPSFRAGPLVKDGALNNIPQDNWEYVLQAKSQQEFVDRKARVLEQLEREKKIAEMGGPAIAGRIAAGLVDLPTLIAFVPGAGGPALLSATSRVANAVRMGLVGAASNVAFDYATMGNRPLATVDDLYISAGMGLGLGFLGGASVNPQRIQAMRLAQEIRQLEDFGLRESLKGQVDEIRRAGFDLTDSGRDVYLKKINELQARVSSEVRRNIEREAALVRRDLGLGFDDNIIRTKLQEEAKTVPVFQRGPMQDPDFGAEQNVRTYFERFGGKRLGNDLSVADFLDRNFEFNKNGTIKKAYGGLSREDLKQLGLNTKSEVEAFARRLAMDNAWDGKFRFAKKESGKEALVRLSASSDPQVAALAKRLSEQLLDDVPIYRIRQKDIDDTFGGKKGQYGGFYASNRHAVFVKDDADDGLMLHELLHAATVHKLDYGLANPSTVHGQLASKLQDIFNEVKQLADQQGFKSYYLTNVKEFTAGLYTGSRPDAKAFQDFLKNIKDSSGDTYLSRVVDIFRKLLGLDDKETNYLLRSLDLTDRLIDEKLTVKMQRPTGSLDTINFAPAAPGVSAEVAEAASKAELSPVFGWGLGLEHRLGSQKVPESVRALASKLFGTTVGYKNHAVVKVNAWDDTVKWADAWAIDFRKGTYTEFMDWFRKSDFGVTEKGKRFEEFGTMVSNYVRGVEGTYPPQVVKAGDHTRKTLAKIVDYINNPLVDEGGAKRGLTMQEIVDPVTGEKSLVGQLDKNPNYLPRKHDINKWNSLVQTYGRDAVEGWWARAHMAGRPNISEEQANRFAKWYVRTVEEAHMNRTQDLVDDMFRGQDRDALRESLKRNGGFSDFEAEKIMEDMFPTRPSDTGRVAASLKHRNTIDERYTETWTSPDGTSVTVGLNDFVHANAFDVVEPYLRRMAGNVALAKHLDVYKVTDIDRLIAEATQNKLGETAKKPAEIARYRDDLKFAFDRIQGIPQEEFTKLNKSFEMWRNFNVIRLMGGAVWNQLQELSQIVGTMGWKTTLDAVPELGKLRRDIMTGKAPNEMLEHLENTIGGAGSEYLARMNFRTSDDWVRNAGDTKMNRWLDTLDTGIRKGAQGVLDYTGMTGVMVQQKRLHSIALVNHFINTANGKPSSFLTKDRLAWMGMDEATAARVMENLKKYSAPSKGEFSSTYKLDFNKWVAEDPESHSAFMNAVHRESRRAIQENDLASMVPIMGTTLGQTVFQFMNFTMQGWNKSLMFGLNHRDWSTLSTVMWGSFLASVTYMGRTMVGAVGKTGEEYDNYMEKRMSTGQIVANSFGRISQMSLLPQVYDTLSPYPLFNGMRTTSDLSSLASNPTYQAINGLISMKNIVRNATSDEYQTSSRDIQTWGKLLPLNNVAPISTFLNSWASDYPRSNKEQ